MDILRSNTRNVSFGYNLLDKNDVFIRTLNNVLSGEVSMTSLAQVKRQLVVNMRLDDEEIDFLNQRIQPFIIFKDESLGLLPSTTLYPSPALYPSGLGEVKYNLGVYLLSSPILNTSEGITTARVTCNSKLEILLNDRIKERIFFEEGSKYTDNIVDVIRSSGITKIKISSSASTLNRDIEYDIGTTKLEIVNDLLDKLNFNSLSSDGDGFVVSEPYVRPSNRSVDIEYADDELSVIFDDGFTEELDVSRTPNRWIAIASNPETVPLTSVYENTDANSPTSIQSRGRVIAAEPLEYTDIASQEVLDEKVRRAAEEDLNVYGNIEFNTAIMPIHGYLDKLEVDFNGNKYEYIETKWKIKLEAGSKMSHNARRVITIE